MPDEVAATLDWKLLIGPGRFFCTSIRSSRKPRFAPASAHSEKGSITKTQHRALERHGDKETGEQKVVDGEQRTTRKNMKKTLRTSLFVITILLLTFQRSQAQDKKLEPFTISYASVSGTRGPLWIAQDLGIFAKYGLDVDLVYIASGVTSVNALLGGSVDIIAASGSSVVSAAARGAPLVIIASLGHIAYKLVALPSITNVQALKGKIIGSSRIGAGTDYALK